MRIQASFHVSGQNKEELIENALTAYRQLKNDPTATLPETSEMLVTASNEVFSDSSLEPITRIWSAQVTVIDRTRAE